MGHLIFAFAMGCALVACNGPRESPLNTSLINDPEHMEAVLAATNKLSAEERDLFGSYAARWAQGADLGAVLRGERLRFSDGMTLGKAIDAERKFRAELVLAEAKLQAQLQPMRDAVTVTIVSKREEQFPSLGTMLQVSFGYRNNTTKDVSGFKGRLSIRDIFGDEISDFPISNDKTIRAGSVETETLGFDYRHKHGKFARLPEEKFTVVWVPEVVIFSDGTKLER